ncbi:ribokinase [Arthrobacter sp. D3-16]
MNDYSAVARTAGPETPRPTNTGRVAVVGSGNLDIVVTLQRIPMPGETVMGERVEEVPGGKGTNQAIAAARRSISAFVGCVGEDEAGGYILRSLELAGVETQHVERSVEPTGRAFIEVTPDGENSIVVVPLANQQINAARVLHALETLQPDVVLTQLEIPHHVVVAVSEWAERNNATFVLNPSPVTALPLSVLSRCDPIILNAEEAREILRMTDGQDPYEAATASVEALTALIARMTRSVVVTDGSRGAYVATASTGVTKITADKVDAVDTTGAGDEFAGALAAGLALGKDLTQAAELAGAAAGLLVQIPRRQRTMGLPVAAGNVDGRFCDHPAVIAE